MKSLLRYPGGKSRAIKILEKYIPDNIKKVVSPFFGGGSFELFLSGKGIEVEAYDLLEPLVCFWNQVISNNEELANKVLEYYPLSKEDFKRLQKDINETYDDTERASKFYVLNKSSFSGSTLSGGMSLNHPRFTQKSIDNIRNFKCNNLSIQCKSFEDVIPNCSEFMYLDPPYYIENNLYGKNGDLHKYFNHNLLCNLLKDKSSWIMSYNDCPEIREMYKEYDIIPLSWKYGMNKNKQSSEILIINT